MFIENGNMTYHQKYVGVLTSFDLEKWHLKFKKLMSNVLLCIFEMHV
jgi:hypothetical protein